MRATFNDGESETAKLIRGYISLNLGVQVRYLQNREENWQLNVHRDVF